MIQALQVNTVYIDFKAILRLENRNKIYSYCLTEQLSQLFKLSHIHTEKYGLTDNQTTLKKTHLKLDFGTPTKWKKKKEK